MKLSCSRETELLAALREQRWPDVCEPELRAHVSACSYCTDLVLVTQAMRQGHREATQQAVLPSAGILWWRAQVQRRNGAIQRVTEPILLAEKLAWAGTCAAALALGLWQRHSIGELFTYLGKIQLPASNTTNPLAGVNGWFIAMLAAAAGTISLLGGLALYLAAKKD